LFEIFTQHGDKEYVQDATIFTTFDYMVQKLLYDMYFSPLDKQFGKVEKITFFFKNENLKLDFSLYTYGKHDLFHFD